MNFHSLFVGNQVPGKFIFSIPRAAGYKFEKFPGVKKFFDRESGMDYYKMVNKVALEKAETNKNVF